MTRPWGPALIGAYAAITIAGEALPGLGPAAAKIAAAAFVLQTLVARRGASPPPLPGALAAWAALGILAAGSLAWTVDPIATRRVVLHLGREALLLGALAAHPRRDAVLRGAALGALAGGAVLGLHLGVVFAWVEDLRGVRVSVGEGEPGVQARAAATGVVLGVAAVAPPPRVGPPRGGGGGGGAGGGGGGGRPPPRPRWGSGSP